MEGKKNEKKEKIKKTLLKNKKKPQWGKKFTKF